MGIARSINYGDAEDLVSEALVKAMKSRHQFQEGTRLDSWVAVILRNLSRSRYRRELRKKPSDAVVWGLLPEEESTPQYGTLQEALDALESIADDPVFHAIMELESKYRDPFLLAVLADFSYKEIALHEGIPLGTVMSRINRARTRVKSLINVRIHRAKKKVKERLIEQGYSACG